LGVGRNMSDQPQNEEDRLRAAKDWIEKTLQQSGGTKTPLKNEDVDLNWNVLHRVIEASTGQKMEMVNIDDDVEEEIKKRAAIKFMVENEIIQQDQIQPKDLTSKNKGVFLEIVEGLQQHSRQHTPVVPRRSEPSPPAADDESAEENSELDETSSQATIDTSKPAVPAEERLMRRTRSQTEGDLQPFIPQNNNHVEIIPIRSPSGQRHSSGLNMSISPRSSGGNSPGESPKKSEEKDEKKKKKLFSFGTLKKSSSLKKAVQDESAKKHNTLGKKSSTSSSTTAVAAFALEPSKSESNTNSSSIFPVQSTPPPSTTPIVSPPTSPDSGRRLSFSAESVIPAPTDSGPRDWAAREIYTSEIAYLKNLDLLVFVSESQRDHVTTFWRQI